MQLENSPGCLLRQIAFQEGGVSTPPFTAGAQRLTARGAFPASLRFLIQEPRGAKSIIIAFEEERYLSWRGAICYYSLHRKETQLENSPGLLMRHIAFPGGGVSTPPLTAGAKRLPLTALFPRVPASQLSCGCCSSMFVPDGCDPDRIVNP